MPTDEEAQGYTIPELTAGTLALAVDVHDRDVDRGRRLEHPAQHHRRARARAAARPAAAGLDAGAEARRARAGDGRDGLRRLALGRRARARGLRGAPARARPARRRRASSLRTERRSPDVVQGDVTDRASVRRALEGCDAVLHAAALVALERAPRGGGAAQRTRPASRSCSARRRSAASPRWCTSRAAPSSSRRAARRSAPTRRSRPRAARTRARRWTASASRARCSSRARRSASPTRAAWSGPDDPGLSEMNHTLVIFLRDLMAMTSSGLSLVDVRDLARIHAALALGKAPPGRYVVGGPFLALAGGRRPARPAHRPAGAPLPHPGRRAARRRARRRRREALRAVRLPADARGHVLRDALARRRQQRGRSTALGLGFRDPAESFADSLRWLARAGHVPAARIGALAEKEG